MIRVLLTCSRGWSDWPTVRETFDCVAMYDDAITLVSGHCPDGDQGCEKVAEILGWTVEPHPANWGRDGKKAGFARNAMMVRLGADMCVAFIGPCINPHCKNRETHDSHGTLDTVTQAHRAHIPIIRIRAKVPA